MENDDPIRLWQSQNVESTNMSIEEIRSKAAKFERRIRARNQRETWAGVCGALVFVFYLFRIPGPLARLGSCLTILGIVYVIYQINSRGRASKAPADAEFETCVAFRRRELERQRDLLRSVWSWYLGPMVPGIVVFLVGTFQLKAHRAADWLFAIPTLLIVGACFWGTTWLNRRAAAKLQHMIDELQGL